MPTSRLQYHGQLNSAMSLSVVRSPLLSLRLTLTYLGPILAIRLVELASSVHVNSKSISTCVDFCGEQSQ